MIADGRDLNLLRNAPWTSVFPGLAIGAATAVIWGSLYFSSSQSFATQTPTDTTSSTNSTLGSR